MPVMTSDQQAEASLRVQIADVTARLGEPNDDQLFEIAAVAGIDLSGNANEFVPWTDPQIDFECSCGARIYSDTVHTH